MDEIHHAVAFDHNRNRQAVAHLDKLGVDIHDPKIIGISLPASNDANPFGKVTHNETRKYVYYDYVQKEILRTGTKQEALATIEKIKMQLMTGKTPWKP